MSPKSKAKAKAKASESEDREPDAPELDEGPEEDDQPDDEAPEEEDETNSARALQGYRPSAPPLSITVREQVIEAVIPRDGNEVDTLERLARLVEDL